MKIKATLIIILLFLVSCTNQSKVLNMNDKDLIINEVEEMFDNYYRDVKVKGLMSEFDYLDDSENFFLLAPGYQKPFTIDELKFKLTENSKRFDTVSFDWEQLTVYPLTPSIANYSGIVNGYVIDTSGTKSEARLIESGTVIKKNGKWKILSGQSAAINN